MEIKEWVKMVINERGWERFDDFHLNELRNVHEKEQWVKILFHRFEEAINSKQAIAPELAVILVVPLETGEELKGFTFKNAEDIKKDTILTPPSFYIFPTNFYVFEDIMKSSKVMDGLRKVPNGIATAYMEYMEPGEDEYRRSVNFLEERFVE